MARPRRHLLWRNLWPAVLVFATGLLGVIFVQPAGTAGLLGAAALAVAVLFATHGVDRTREQQARLELLFTIEMALGADLNHNRTKLERLTAAVQETSDGGLRLLVMGKFRFRAANLVLHNLKQLEWDREFASRVLAMYDNLKEVEDLRETYSLCAATTGPNEYLLTLAERLQDASNEQLKEVGPVEEWFRKRNYYRHDSLMAALYGRGVVAPRRDRERGPPSRAPVP